METNEFLAAVYEVIRLNYPAGQPDGISAARVGVLVRQAFPGISWESLGFPKLKHLLASLEAQGLVRVGPNSNLALSVWLTDASPASQGAPPQPRSKPRDFLRKDVWNAFVLILPRGRRFLNRRNGTVRMAASDVPDSSGDWKEIEPINQQTQTSWAEGFLESNQLLSVLPFATLLREDDWYRSLRDELFKARPTLVTDWNRVRTQNVVAHVRQWCESNSVPEDLVFEQSRSIHPPTPRLSSTANIRSAVLRTVERMSLDELLEIRIPAKLLVEQLLPRCIQEADSIREAGR